MAPSTALTILSTSVGEVRSSEAGVVILICGEGSRTSGCQPNLSTTLQGAESNGSRTACQTTGRG